ncbi:MAG: DUF1631 domain-containing protein [Burkholderiales bacterium]
MSKHEPSTITHIPAGQSTLSAADANRLLQECRKMAQERLAQSLTSMLNKMEETLWKMAEGTKDRELQDVYLLAKDKAKAQRAAIERQFKQRFDTEFDRRLHKQPKSEEGPSDFDLSTMTLVEDEDLSGALKVKDLSTKARGLYSEELNALDQRIGVLIRDPQLKSEDNPLSPDTVYAAFKQACDEIEAGLKVKMVILSLFDEQVRTEMNGIYKDINSLLVKNSVLPQIRFGGGRTPGGAPNRGAAAALAAAAMAPGAQRTPQQNAPAGPGMGGPAQGAAGMGGMGGPSQGGAGIQGQMHGGAMPGAMPEGYAAPTGETAAGGSEQDFFGLLQGLLIRQYGGGAPVAGSAGATAPTSGPATGPGGAIAGGYPNLGVGGGTMTGNYPHPGSPGGGMPGGYPGSGPVGGGTSATPTHTGSHVGSATGPVRILSGADLVGALTQIQHGDASVIKGVPNSLAAAIAAPGAVNILRDIKSTPFGQGMGEADNMTLDIVSMLFDHILDDKKIPDAMKVLIGRLQIPILKVAILDKSFFQTKQHPARRMLNTLGEFGLGLGADFQISNPLFKQVSAILQNLIQQFKDDLSLFEKAETDLEQVIASEDRRAETEASRAARLMELREKLEVSRATAQAEVKNRAEAGQMPQAVLKFLAEEWIKLLVMAHAKAGAESPAWKSAIETMDQLIWSVSPKPTSDERRKLGSLLPVLLKRVEKGMQIVGTQEEVRKKFLSKLMRCHTKVINSAGDALRKAARATAATAAKTEPARTPASASPPSSLDTIPTLSEEVDMQQDSSGKPPAFAGGAGAQPASPEATLAVDIQFDSLTGDPGEGTPASEFENTAADSNPETDEDTRMAETLPPFKSLIIKNPFGEGEIEVEEVSLDDLPAFSSGRASQTDTVTSRSGDEYSIKAGSMAVGTWIEIRSAEDVRTQARLSWISPLKGTYLFTNRHGAKVAEFSLYQLAKEMRQGGCVIMEEVPLFDRAMSSLVGVLRKDVH